MDNKSHVKLSSNDLISDLAVSSIFFFASLSIVLFFIPRFIESPEIIMKTSLSPSVWPLISSFVMLFSSAAIMITSAAKFFRAHSVQYKNISVQLCIRLFALLMAIVLFIPSIDFFGLPAATAVTLFFILMTANKFRPIYMAAVSIFTVAIMTFSTSLFFGVRLLN